jgi:hypothetical protein
MSRQEREEMEWDELRMEIHTHQDVQDDVPKIVQTQENDTIPWWECEACHYRIEGATMRNPFCNTCMEEQTMQEHQALYDEYISL